MKVKEIKINVNYIVEATKLSACFLVFIWFLCTCQVEISLLHAKLDERVARVGVKID